MFKTQSEQIAAYWDRVWQLRTQPDQRCENCHEVPNYAKGFFTRVTLKNPLGPRKHPENIGLFCYRCRMKGTPTPGRQPHTTAQLSLLEAQKL